MKTVWITAAAALVLLSGCGSETQRATAAGAPAAPVAVGSRNSKAMDWPDTYEATGTVRARATTVISSRMVAYAQQVNAQVGDHVKAGQVLVVLDARDLDASKARAQAAQAEVKSAMPEADSGIAAARSALELAQSTFRRIEELAGKNSVSKQELDEASARVKGAQANYEMARARRTQLDSKLAQVEQEIRSVEIARDYARITAPFAGIVASRSVEPGTLTSPGTPLLTLEREGEYRLEAAVDEMRLPAVKVGQAVEVVLESLDRKVAARVGEVVPAVDPGSRSYTVKIDLPGANVRTGMFGRAIFSLGTRKVTAIPGNALVERGQIQSVFVIEDGVARLRMVTTGKRMPDAIEVLSGLSGGEKLVAPVPDGLADGARVEVRQ